MIAPARKPSILSMPSWRILEQSKPGGTSGLMYWDLVVILYCGCACKARACEDAPALGLNGFAAVARPPKATSEMPARATQRPIKTRRLKNADCVVDFFFMSDDEVELSLNCEGSVVAGRGMRVNTSFIFLRFFSFR